MNKKTFAGFVEKLKKRAQELSESIALADEAVRAPAQKGDEVDQAQAINTAAEQAVFRARLKTELTKVEAALARTCDPHFGDCAACGEEIGDKRLEANAVATLCFGCQEDKERAARK